MFHARLAHSSCKSLVLTRDLMAPATFLLHFAPSVPALPKIYPNYLNWETYSKQILSTWTSHSNPSSPFSTRSPYSFLDWLSILSFYTFQQIAPFIPASSKTFPKYLNSETYSKQISSMWASHSNFFSPLLCSYLHWLSNLSFYMPHQTHGTLQENISPEKNVGCFVGYI